MGTRDSLHRRRTARVAYFLTGDLLVHGLFAIAAGSTRGPEFRPTSQGYHGYQSHLGTVRSIMSTMNDVDTAATA